MTLPGLPLILTFPVNIISLPVLYVVCGVLVILLVLSETYFQLHFCWNKTFLSQNRSSVSFNVRDTTNNIRRTLWVRILLRRGVLDTTLCDKACQWLRQVGGFFRALWFPLPIKLTVTIWLKYCWKWR